LPRRGRCICPSGFHGRLALVARPANSPPASVPVAQTPINRGLCRTGAGTRPREIYDELLVRPTHTPSRSHRSANNRRMWQAKKTREAATGRSQFPYVPWRDDHVSERTTVPNALPPHLEKPSNNETLEIEPRRSRATAKQRARSRRRIAPPSARSWRATGGKFQARGGWVKVLDH